MSRRAADTAIRIPRRTMLYAVTAIAVVVLVTLFVGVSALLRGGAPTTVANPAQVKYQQTAAERDVERAYEQASDQVKRVRGLNLAITTAQADQIAGKALTDLKNLRHSAFVSLAQIVGSSAGDADLYATSTEQRFDGAPVGRQPAPTPVLLAPRFYTIAARMSDLATQLADVATNELTASPSSTPAPSPSGSARPTPSPSPSR